MSKKSYYVAVHTVQFIDKDGKSVTVNARDLTRNEKGVFTDIPAEALDDLKELAAVRDATADEVAGFKGEKYEDADDAAAVAAADKAAAEAAAEKAAASKASAAEEAAAAKAAAKAADKSDAEKLLG